MGAGWMSARGWLCPKWLVAASACALLAATETRAEMEWGHDTSAISEGWAERWGDDGKDWRPVADVTHGATKEAGVGTYWIKRRLPPFGSDDPAVIFEYPVQIMEVFIDGHMRYSTGDVRDAMAHPLRS